MPVAAVGIETWAELIRESPGAQEVPVVVVWGERDDPNGARAQLYDHAFPHAKKVVVENGHHAAYLDDPDLFHDTLVELALETHHRALALGKHRSSPA